MDVCGTGHTGETFTIAQLWLREFFFSFLIFVFALFAYVSFLIMYSTGGIRDLMLVMLLSFPPMSGKTFVSSQTYSCAEGREEGLGWPFVITIIVFLSSIPG